MNHNPLLRCVALTALSSIGILAGCHHHHGDDYYDGGGGVVFYDEDGRFEHRGYYDADHNWRGGYYDEHHTYHTDPHDFRGVERDARGPRDVHDNRGPHDAVRPDEGRR